MKVNSLSTDNATRRSSYMSPWSEFWYRINGVRTCDVDMVVRCKDRSCPILLVEGFTVFPNEGGTKSMEYTIGDAIRLNAYSMAVYHSNQEPLLQQSSLSVWIWDPKGNLVTGARKLTGKQLKLVIEVLAFQHCHENDFFHYTDLKSTIRLSEV